MNLAIQIVRAVLALYALAVCALIGETSIAENPPAQPAPEPEPEPIDWRADLTDLDLRGGSLLLGMAWICQSAFGKARRICQ